MSKHNDVQLMFYEYLRNELPSAELAIVEAHIPTCKECALELETLRETLAAFPAPSTQPSEQQAKEFWNAFAANVAENAIKQKPNRRNPFAEAVDWLSELFLIHPKYTFAIAGSFALIVAALAFWTFLTPAKHDLALDGHSTPLKHQPTLTSPNGETTGEQTVPVERVSQYFKKSKMLLVGVVNMKTEQDEPLDFSTERRVSRDLVREARYLKRQPIDPRSRRLMNDLERILIELGNIEEKNDLPNVEIIRGGIHQENLLFKIRMAEAMYDSSNFMYTSERR